MLVPKLVTTLGSYSRRQFLGDAVAGVIVGIVALPLAIAFAIASGVSPERGVFTAIGAGFLISALGGSRVQIGGGCAGVGRTLEDVRGAPMVGAMRRDGRLQRR